MGASALPWDFTSWYLFGGLAVILIGFFLYMFTALKDLRRKLKLVSNIPERAPLVGSVSCNGDGSTVINASSLSSTTLVINSTDPTQTPEDPAVLILGE